MPGLSKWGGEDRAKLPPVRVGLVPLLTTCLGLCACGGSGGGASHAVTTRPVPAYRVGQYCVEAKAAEFHRYSLVCVHHHLARD